jgi:ornithine cyclodeaminase/alanine dehydrogenase-like protein (mu-crystallin family)
MKVISLETIRAALSPADVLDAVRYALIAHAESRTIVPAPIHLSFPRAGGDAHVKAGMIADSATFTVKLATGFYLNASRGLPSTSGVVIVASAETGEVLAILDDRGWLTATRTAAAAALATDALAPPGPLTLGVIGTGTQASLAADWLRLLRPVKSVLIAGRRPEAARDLAQRIGGAAAASLSDVLAQADVVLTATASATALFPANAARPGTHFTALGADMPGKQELPEGLFAAACVTVDDLDQASDHGELAHALRARVLTADRVMLLGSVLRDQPDRPPNVTTIADLTGVGALDAALAEKAFAATCH